MKVVCWNMRRATAASAAWDYLLELNPDLALLQEVSSIPPGVSSAYATLSATSPTKSGGRQRFSTVILARAPEVEPFQLTSDIDWVQEELARFSGNLLACRTEVCNLPLTVVSVHSPAWPIDAERLAPHDVSVIKLKQNPRLWVTELLWAAVRDRDRDEAWLVGGDLNASETFDTMWRGGPRGNRELLDRMEAAGFTEVLRHCNGGEITPTFRNTGDGRVIHQIDHLFVAERLLPRLENCVVGEAERVLATGLSDHLPIIASFHRTDGVD